MKRRSTTRSSPTRKRLRGTGSPTPRASDEAATHNVVGARTPAGACASHGNESPRVVPPRCESEDESSLAICDERRVQAVWDEVAGALNRVARCLDASEPYDLTADEYQRVYRRISDIFQLSNDAGEPLKRAFYVLLHRYLRAFVDAQLAQLRGLAGVDLLAQYVRRWSLSVRFVNTLFKWTTHMHKYWVPNAHGGVTVAPVAVMSVERLRLSFWKLCMQKHVPYLTDHIIALINRDRESTCDPSHMSNTRYIRQTLGTFCSIGALDIAPDHDSSIPSNASEGLKFYETAFERDFLRATTVYYRRVSSSHANMDAAECVASISQILEDEERRLSRYVEERTHAPIRCELEKLLVESHKAKFDEFAKKLVAAPPPLSPAGVSSLRKVVSLLSRVDGGLDGVRDTFRECVVTEGRQCIATHMPSLNVTTSSFSKFLPLMKQLLKVHDRRLRMLHESFDNRNGFARALDSGFREVMNRLQPSISSPVQHSMAVTLAYYAHHVLTARILVDVPFIPRMTAEERKNCIMIETVVASSFGPVNKRMRRTRMVLPLTSRPRNDNTIDNTNTNNTNNHNLDTNSTNPYSLNRTPEPPSARTDAVAVRGSSHNSVVTPAGPPSRRHPPPAISASTVTPVPDTSRDPRVRGLRRSARLRRKSTSDVSDKEEESDELSKAFLRKRDRAGQKVLLDLDKTEKNDEGEKCVTIRSCDVPNRQRDEVLVTHVHRCVRLFAFLENKNEFFEVCRHLMAQRLVGEYSERVEHKFINGIREYAGGPFTSKLEGMLEDIVASKRMNEKFSSSVNDCTCTNGVLMKYMPLLRESNVHMVKAVYWPKFVKKALKLPRAMRVVEETFEQHLRISASGQSRRKITWIHSHGTVHVKATVAGRQFTVDATVMQACVLMQLNTRKDWTISALADAINADVHEVRRHLRPLCEAGLIMLDDGDVAVNEQFSGADDPKRMVVARTKVGIFSPKSPCALAEAPRHGVIERETQLDAAVVRIMKKAKKLRVRNILAALAEMNGAIGGVTQLELEERVNSLVDRDLLSVDKEAIDDGGGQTVLYNV